MREKQKLYFIVGPTASGKTAASIEVAKRIDAEVISADSIQVYRGMDIGSAKPSMEERTGIPHHMLSVVAPDEPKFSVARFREMADACIVRHCRARETSARRWGNRSVRKCFDISAQLYGGTCGSDDS